jgi:ABC-type transport system involved in multi-copper enzyme maturation permease subunit
MKKFSAFFVLESKGFFCKINIGVFILFLILSAYFTQAGIKQYEEIVDSKEKFQEIEDLKVKQYLRYTQYASYGFRILFIPSALSAYFSNSSVLSQLTAVIDAADVLNIYNPYKGKTLYAEKSGGFKDVSGVILLLGSLFMLYLGYDSFRRREYTRYLTGLTGHKYVFFSIILTRVILAGLFFLVQIGSTLILFKMNHIALSANHYYHLSVFAAVMFLMLLFFFAFGAFIGGFKSLAPAIIMIGVVWFVFVFLFPGVVKSLVSAKAENITSTYQLEFENLKLVMDYERRAFNEVGIFRGGKDVPEQVIKLAESFRDNEFVTIQEKENKLKKKHKDNLIFFQKLSVIFPTTFYLSVNNEIGSRGYENYHDFYSYIQKLKREFLNFYLDRKFHSDPENKNIEPFTKGDENLFYAQSRLPAYMIAGIVVTLFHILILFALSFWKYKKAIFFRPRGKGAEIAADLDIELKKGETYVLLTTGSILYKCLYGFLCGEDRGFEGLVRLDDKKLVPGDADRGIKTGDFLYICPPGEMPVNMRVGDFVSFAQKVLKISNKEIAGFYLRLGIEHIEGKRFRELPPEHMGKFLLTVSRLKKSKIYMLRDFVKDMPPEFTQSFMEELVKMKEQGAAVLYISDDVLLASKIGDSAGSLRIAHSPRLDPNSLV